MNRRRVKITGLGFVTPAGVGIEEFRRGITESRSRVVSVTRFPPEAGPFVAAEISHFDVGRYFPQPGFKRLPRHTQFALTAARFALSDASKIGRAHV